MKRTLDFAILPRINGGNMQTISLLAALLLPIGTPPMSAQHTATVTHNTWTSGTPMPTPVVGPSAAVLGDRIYVVGGLSGHG